MKRFVIAVIIIAAVFLSVYIFLSKSSKEIPSDTIYTCAMHPEVELPRPGKCPKCGMELFPKKKGEPREFLVLTDQQIQQAGVRYANVQKRKLVKYIETTGRIAYDERKLQRITSWSGGRIDKLYVAFTGDFVKKGQLLAEIYSPRLLFALDELAIALNTLAKLKKSQHPNRDIIAQTEETIASNKNLLRRLGLKEDQIKKVEENVVAGKEPYSEDKIPGIPIYSPLEGFVIHKGKDEGAYVSEGDDILRIVDLTKVWIYVDIYEYELPYVRLEQQVEITTRAYPDKKFVGEVIYIDPFLQPMTRTIRVRCEVDNKDFLLKPDMFANARIKIEFPEILSLPTDAVLLSGLRNIVILKAGSGKFRPVEVEIGRRWLYPLVSENEKRDIGYFEPYEKYHEVVVGLSEGDIVVTAGAFLLNSEANFQRVLTKMLPPEEEKPQMQELREPLEKILGPYFKIADSLANDDITHLEHLLNEIKGLTNEIGEFKRIREIAGEKSQAIEDARIIFSELSRETVTYTRKIMPDKIKDKKIFLIKCPMTRFEFTIWLQNTPNVKNPYLGKKMVTCGVILEE